MNIFRTIWITFWKVFVGHRLHPVYPFPLRLNRPGGHGLIAILPFMLSYTTCVPIFAFNGTTINSVPGARYTELYTRIYPDGDTDESTRVRGRIERRGRRIKRFGIRYEDKVRDWSFCKSPMLIQPWIDRYINRNGIKTWWIVSLFYRVDRYQRQQIESY